MVIERQHLERLHFNKGDKVKYRLVVTIGALGTGLLTIIGLSELAILCNIGTCIVWIWE